MALAPTKRYTKCPKHGVPLKIDNACPVCLADAEKERKEKRK